MPQIFSAPGFIRKGLDSRFLTTMVPKSTEGTKLPLIQLIKVLRFSSRRCNACEKSTGSMSSGLSIACRGGDNCVKLFIVITPRLGLPDAATSGNESYI